MKVACGILGVILVATPAFSQDVEPAGSYASFDMNLSTFDLSRDGQNDPDFDNSSVFLPNGQARVRHGNFIGEIQGTTSTAVDAHDDDENSSSFGVIGHYVFGLGSGEAAFSLGTMGGTNVEENDGTWYSSLAAGYASGDWMVGLGRLSYLGGQDGDNSVVSFNYIQAAYDHDLSDKFSMFAAGYYGNGKTSSDSVIGYNVDLGVRYAVDDNMTVSASIGRFGLHDPDDPFNHADGYSVNIGLNIAIGGASKEARDAIRFDTPNFHREMTWCDEAGC